MTQEFFSLLKLKSSSITIIMLQNFNKKKGKMNKAIEKIGAPTAGMIYFLFPLFSGLVAWIFLGEGLKLYQLASGTLIVVGIIVSNRSVVKNNLQ